MTTFRASDPLPKCPACGGLARPNVLMFGDPRWNAMRTGDQHDRLARWLESLSGSLLAVVEIGAGTAVPTVRRFSEALTRRYDATLIRINPRQQRGPVGTIELGLGGADGLQGIERALQLM